MLTNYHFSKEDKAFRDACVLADIPSTRRQASKFRAGKGIAYKVLMRKRNTANRDSKGRFIKNNIKH